MRITYYLYNAFIIETNSKKIAIDPGGLFLYFLRLTTLIPKSQWESITHLLITHGDPDHYWHFDRVRAASGAKVICNETMVHKKGEQWFMLGPRSRGVVFTLPADSPNTLRAGELISLDGMRIQGIKTVHGELQLKLGPLSTTVKPGPTERIGWGSLGFHVELDGKSFINLGDTLLLKHEWELVPYADVLMIPIGGKVAHNTMDEREALKAVKLFRPKLVIPCHYNCPAFFTKSYNKADVHWFRNEVEKLGIDCEIMGSGDVVVC